MKAQIEQIHYNNNRVALNSSISTVLEILTDIQQENKQLPICYPSLNIDDALNSENSNKALKRASTISSSSKSFEKSHEITSSSSSNDIPRLVTPQVSKNFNILNIDLKMGGSKSSCLVDALEKSSVASLFDEKITQAIRHLFLLRERIEDTSSKVLVTGDLNAGKSTFCNALLRRKLLPEDQQPCTNVFCEVIDSKVNSGLEEVHAVEIGINYDRLDESTYTVFQLKELEDLVLQSDIYSILKVYVDDKRSIEKSLLRNGVIDIAIIDAPGLNIDSYQTTQLFSRQEEIDLIVFVVSAENHFTLSAKEFISAANSEKSLIFIVVNKFDNIKDKSRCMNQIMKQVSKLSPETHKDASEFVHFVSSENVLEDAIHNGGGDDPDFDPDHNNNNNNNNNGDPDFDRLEESLRRFVLEKRSISKLAPVKKYLLNLLNDLNILSNLNINISKEEKLKAKNQLESINPKIEKDQNELNKLTKKLDKIIDLTANDVSKKSREMIEKAVYNSGKTVKYNGLIDAWNYAETSKQVIINSISQSVEGARSYAEKKASTGIDSIRQLGIDKYGQGPWANGLYLLPGTMFASSQSTEAIKMNIGVDITDFFNLSTDTLLSRLSVDNSKQLNSTGLSPYLSLGTLACGGQLLRIKPVVSTISTILPFIDSPVFKKSIGIAAIAAGVTIVGLIVLDVPRAITYNLSRKIKSELDSKDYINTNVDRIERMTRKTFRYPKRTVRHLGETKFEKTLIQKNELKKIVQDTDHTYQYFIKLGDRISEEEELIRSYDLESISNSID